MIGFSFAEQMVGCCRTSDGCERPFAFRVRCIARAFPTFVRTKVVSLEGTVDLDGVGAGMPMRGTLLIDPFVEHRLRYGFRFTDGAERPWTFEGEKKLSGWHLLDTLTTLEGRLACGDAPFATAVLRFDPRELPEFLASFRLVASGRHMARVETLP